MLAFIARKICRRVGKIDVDDVPHTLPQLFMYFLCKRAVGIMMIMPKGPKNMYALRSDLSELP